MANNYTDFLFYAGTFLGDQIDAEDYPRLNQKASAWIDQLTFGRAFDIVDAGTDTDTIEKIKLATCAIAEVLLNKEGEQRSISSESVGGHSVSYVTSEEDKQGYDHKMRNVAKLYLNDTGLMFRGFNEDEKAA